VRTTAQIFKIALLIDRNCAAWYSLTGTLFGIMAFSILYGISEYCKIKNKSFLLQSLISKMQREDEKKRFAKAPLFLAVGVSAVLLLYSPLAAWVAIYHAGFCDTMASVFGKKWGKTRIPFSPEKSLLGSGLFFLSALPVLFLILPYSKAVVVALVATFLAMLPFKDLDNLEKGDVITTTTFQKNGKIIIYRYQVSDKFVTVPNDARIFENSDSPILTLSTCWPIGTAFRRLIVKAELQK